jgi:hypothetical protein
MLDLIPAEHGIFDRHLVATWIPALAEMTILGYLIGAVINRFGTNIPTYTLLRSQRNDLSFCFFLIPKK